MTKLISTNPGKNYEPVGSVTVSTLKEIKQKVALAHKAKKQWQDIGVEKRVVYLRKIHHELLTKRNRIIDSIVKENGKCLKDARSEFDRYNSAFQWFLGNAKDSLRDEITHEDEKTIHKIVYEPFGVAAIILPWNHPFGMFVWGVVPNLLAGNTVILKHSEECPLTAKLIEKIIDSTKHPRGVFSEIYGDGKVGKILLDQNISLVWFTGSSLVG